MSVARIDGQAKQIVAAPILTPMLTGWILFASDLDAGEMRSLESFRQFRFTPGDREAGWPVEPCCGRVCAA
jgi:hypothetical protein